jgi:hypothetical protein
MASFTTASESVLERPESGDDNVAAWRQVHATLLEAVNRAQLGVQAQRAQRRFWLEEICGNLTDHGKLVVGSVWRRPAASLNQHISPPFTANINETVPGISHGKNSSKKTATKQNYLDENKGSELLADVKPAKKGRKKKRPDEPSEAASDDAVQLPTKKRPKLIQVDHPTMNSFPNVAERTSTSMGDFDEDASALTPFPPQSMTSFHYSHASSHYVSDPSSMMQPLQNLTPLPSTAMMMSSSPWSNAPTNNLSDNTASLQLMVRAT